MKVLGNRLLVRREAPPKPPNSLIEVVGNEEPSMFARVLTVSSTIDGVGPNDRVIIKQYCGTPVSLDGEELLIITDDDVLAVVED